MSLPTTSGLLPFLIIHTLFTAVTGICLAALVLSAALSTRQGGRLYTLLLLVLLPATAAALTLPLLLPLDRMSLLLPFLQGVLIGPAISLAPLYRLKDAPSAWGHTAQELGATAMTRVRLLWLPLLGRPLAGSVCLALALSLLAALGISKAPLS